MFWTLCHPSRRDTNYLKEDFKQCLRKEASHCATEGEFCGKKICKVIKMMSRYLFSYIGLQLSNIERKERREQSSHFRGKQMAPDGSVTETLQEEVCLVEGSVLLSKCLIKYIC